MKNFIVSCGQTDGPNWLKFFRKPIGIGYPGGELFKKKYFVSRVKREPCSKFLLYGKCCLGEFCAHSHTDPTIVPRQGKFLINDRLMIRSHST